MHAFASRCVLLFFIIAVALNPAVTQAQESASEAQQEPVLEVEEIVVSTTRLPSVEESIYAVPSKVTIITAEEIEQSGAKTVQEAIQQATGIIMYDQVGNAFGQKIDLRGFNGDPVTTTSVFVDGVLANEPDFNTVNFDLIPIESIERIEILPGASATYGKNALGGVINIITKRGGKRHQLTQETSFGSFHRERYTTSASGPIGKVDYWAAFTREIEDGFRDESDARISRFFGKLGYRPTDRTDLTLSYTYVKSRILQAGTLRLDQAAVNRNQNTSPGDFFDNENNVLRFTGRQELPFGFSLNSNAFYRRLGQEQFTNSGGGFTADSLNQTESRGGVLQVTHEWTLLSSRNVLVLGGEYTRNDFSTRSLDFGSPGLTSKDEDILALFAQDTFNVTSHLTLSGGIRYDHDQIGFTDNLSPSNNASRRFSRVTPRAGLTYSFNPRASLYFSFSEGFRTPTVDEMFTRLGSSNVNLKPVRSRGFEVGLKSGLGTWGTAELAVYQTDVRDEIFFTCTVCTFGDPAFDGFNRNIDKSRRRGFEATVKVRFSRQFDVGLNYSYTEAQFRTATTISTGGTVSVVDAGDSIPLVPKNRLSVTGNYGPIPGLTLSLSGSYVSTQFHLNDNGNAQPRLPGYFVLNGRAAYELPGPYGRFKAFLTVNNLLDKEYFSYGIFSDFSGRNVMPAPGIAVYGGLSYRFEAFPG